MNSEDFTENKKRFLAELKAAREDKELELSRLSERSKIALSYLEKLEEGDWDFLSRAYIRSFLKTYAQYVGIQIEDALRRFDEIVGQVSVPKSQQTTYDDSLEVTQSESADGLNTRIPLSQKSAYSTKSFQTFSGKSIYWIMGVVLIIIVVSSLIYLTQRNNNNEVSEIPFDEVVEEHEQMVGDIGTEQPLEESVSEMPESTTESLESYEEPQAAKGLTLDMIATDECYIRVTADKIDNIIDDVVLIKGFKRSYHADSLFMVVLGNAGGIKLSLNGEELGELGEIGRVVTVTLGEDGLRKLRRGILKTPKADVDVPEKSPADSVLNAVEKEENTSEVLENPVQTDTSQNRSDEQFLEKIDTSAGIY
ncbi:MAG: DUF4115 domain-containing protein [Candidatus Electryonea clarkiae]|nr:DUF4115 domain-containing protein [Candidatus Electryonea clarkiae]MDP8288992.1 DUF4115 domain-containing protein [Candidatus Electryonea clarkiae]